LLADLSAERPIIATKENSRIIVEIKSFAGRSFVKELQQALGQYKIYLDIIELTGLDHELYLAVSHLTYKVLFRQKAAQMVLRRHQLRVLVRARSVMVKNLLNRPDLSESHAKSQRR
jgi:hypothetical protein